MISFSPLKNKLKQLNDVMMCVGVEGRGARLDDFQIFVWEKSYRKSEIQPPNVLSLKQVMTR